MNKTPNYDKDILHDQMSALIMVLLTNPHSDYHIRRIYPFDFKGIFFNIGTKYKIINWMLKNQIVSYWHKYIRSMKLWLINIWYKNSENESYQRS